MEMNRFFNPDSIAVVGASERGQGAFMIDNLSHGYRGKVYPVNPKYSEIHGVPCYPSVDRIPGPVDLALVSVPAKMTPEVLVSCAAKGVPCVMIQSAGFAEAGGQGQKLQHECINIAKRAGIRIWGPNCMGMVDVPAKRLFTPMHPRITKAASIPGRVSMVVQSGMLSAGFLVELMSRRAIGISKVCSIGNRADVDECDILQFLLNDENTDAIVLYLESIPRGRRFLEIAYTSVKPIIVLMGGTSQSGARAAVSHTASLAGNARLTKSVLESAGVILAKDFHHMVELARTVAMVSDIPPRCKVAIVTFSGGAGILSCDLLEQHGLTISNFSAQTIHALSQIFPPWMTPDNPVDLFPAMVKMGREPAIEASAEIVLQDPDVDVLLVEHLLGLDDTQLNLAYLKDKADKLGKALVFWGIGFQEAFVDVQLEAQRLGFPVFSELSMAADCIAASAQFQRQRLPSGLPAAEIAGDQTLTTKPASSPTTEPKIKDEYDSKSVLAASGIPVVEEKLIGSLSEAIDAANEINYPVAIKGLLPDVVHKSEQGLVHLSITGPAILEEAFLDMVQKMEGKGRVLIQRSVKGEYELIVGFLRDPQFGPCVMVGLGGLFAELEPDVAFSPAPLDQKMALELLDRLRSQKLLNGFRGLSSLNRKSMADLIVNLGRMGATDPTIEQIDINPVIISGGQPVAVDATIVHREIRPEEM